jgi:hypothetical protein
MEEVRRLCVQEADPPIPLAFYASADLYVAELFEMSQHLRLSILALFLDRDASFTAEATELLDKAEDPIDQSYDFYEYFEAVSDDLCDHNLFCENCAKHWQEDAEIGRTTYDKCDTDEARIRYIKEFKLHIKGRYCKDYTALFPNVLISNHGPILEKIEKLLQAHEKEDYVVLLDVIYEGNLHLLRYGTGAPDFAKELIESI